MTTIEGAEDNGNLLSPLLRISVLGTLDIQWPSINIPFPKERMLGRGAAPALGLLKAHLTQPDRFALRDWLMEQFWPKSPYSNADERLDDVTSALRGLLRPPESHAKILHFVYGKDGKGNGYRLEGYPQIWVDADAFEWYVQQAARLDRFGHDSLSLWEQAYQLGSRGEFLPDERYSDWVQPRRELLQGQYRQCVHRMVQLLREGGAYEEALLRLRSYWQGHQTDEDALRPLLEMLGTRERYQEAEEYYGQAREAVQQEEHRDLDEKTKDVMECLRAQPIQRERAIQQALSVVTQRPLQGEASKLDLWYRSIQQQESSRGETIITSSSVPTDSYHMTLFQHISTLLSSSPMTLQELNEYTVMLWRHRSAGMFSTGKLYFQTVRHLDTLKALLEHTLLPSERLRLCDITSRATLLAGVFLYDMGMYPQSRQAMQTAIQAAVEANNLVLQVIIWTWMSFTWTYTKSVSLALPCILEASAMVAQVSDRNVKAWVGAVQAEIHARLKQSEKCLDALKHAEQNLCQPSEETFYLFGFDAVLLDGYKGTCLQQLYREDAPDTHQYLQESESALMRALASEAPTRRKLYYLGDRAKIEARRGQVEAACQYATQCITNMGQIESKSIWERLNETLQLLLPYSDTAYVDTLKQQIAIVCLSRQNDKASSD